MCTKIFVGVVFDFHEGKELPMCHVHRTYTQWLALLVVVVGLVGTQTLALGANPPPPSGGLPQQVAALQAQIDALVNPPPPATRFVDNGDGTITDLQTALMWQKQDEAGGLTDKDLVRSWNVTPADTSDSAAGSSIFT